MVDEGEGAFSVHLVSARWRAGGPTGLVTEGEGSSRFLLLGGWEAGEQPGSQGPEREGSRQGVLMALGR